MLWENWRTSAWQLALQMQLNQSLLFGIKIYQNIVYHLTIQKPYNVDRNMSGAASFANAIKSKSFDGSNFKRWRELVTLWLTAMNVMYVVTEKALEGVSEEKFNSIIKFVWEYLFL
jgi:hypothetical protein